MTFLTGINFSVALKKIKENHEFQKQSFWVSRQGASAGFTLIEFLLVMVIIACLLGLAFPRLQRNIKTNAFGFFVEKTYLLLDYARTRAILKSIIVQIKFDQEAKKIVLVEKDNTLNTTLSSVFVPEEISCQSAGPVISFFPDGTSEKIKIVISSRAGLSSIISGSGADGKITVEKDI